MTDALTNKVALVTGGSRGLGRAIALGLAEAGADVAVNYRSQADRAEAVCAEIERGGRRSKAVAADVSNAEDVARLIEAVQDELGPIGILVNNAGIARVQGLQAVSEQEWNEVIGANLTSAFLVTQAVLPSMRANQWGRIVNLSSAAAQVGGIIGPHYAASKAGMLGLTHFYAANLASEGITVNAIAPGVIKTDMTAEMDPERARIIPVRRFGEAHEIAEAAVTLARNGYMTGQTVSVNGGWYMT